MMRWRGASAAGQDSAAAGDDAATQSSQSLLRRLFDLSQSQPTTAELDGPSRARAGPGGLLLRDSVCSRPLVRARPADETTGRDRVSEASTSSVLNTQPVLDLTESNGGSIGKPGGVNDAGFTGAGNSSPSFPEKADYQQRSRHASPREARFNLSDGFSFEEEPQEVDGAVTNGLRESGLSLFAERDELAAERDAPHSRSNTTLQQPSSLTHSKAANQLSSSFNTGASGYSRPNPSLTMFPNHQQSVGDDGGKVPHDRATRERNEPFENKKRSEEVTEAEKVLGDRPWLEDRASPFFSSIASDESISLRSTRGVFENTKKNDRQNGRCTISARDDTDDLPVSHFETEPVDRFSDLSRRLYAEESSAYSGTEPKALSGRAAFDLTSFADDEPSPNYPNYSSITWSERNQPWETIQCGMSDSNQGPSGTRQGGRDGLESLDGSLNMAMMNNGSSFSDQFLRRERTPAGKSAKRYCSYDVDQQCREDASDPELKPRGDGNLSFWSGGEPSAFSLHEQHGRQRSTPVTDRRHPVIQPFLEVSASYLPGNLAPPPRQPHERSTDNQQPECHFSAGADRHWNQSWQHDDVRKHPRSWTSADSGIDLFTNGSAYSVNDQDGAIPRNSFRANDGNVLGRECDSTARNNQNSYCSQGVKWGRENTHGMSGIHDESTLADSIIQDAGRGFDISQERTHDRGSPNNRPCQQANSWDQDRYRLHNGYKSHDLSPNCCRTLDEAQVSRPNRAHSRNHQSASDPTDSGHSSAQNRHPPRVNPVEHRGPARADPPAGGLPWCPEGLAAGAGGAPAGLRAVSELPERYRAVFSEFPYFNRVQSSVLDDALYSDRALVVSAPTGSGKTVVFELAIVRLLMQCEAAGKPPDCTVVYMAPMKALCTERCSDWSAKFAPLGLECGALTGDSEGDDYADLQRLQLVLTTPEKWDSVTRRWADMRRRLRTVRLLLIDEVHLLNDPQRGPTMEAVVTRMKNAHELSRPGDGTEATGPPVRFLAVSATIPNAEDVGEWLGSRQSPAVTHKMDESLRPVRLRRVVLGYPCSERWSHFRFDLSLNYKLAAVIHTYSEQKPTLVFCGTRKGCVQAAQVVVKEARFVASAEHKVRLTSSANLVTDNAVRDLLLSGVGVHHAGLLPQDRHCIERLFLAGDLPVLFCTSTLAMGVNLPAHLVVIKSTSHYTANGCEPYSDSEILQMTGRAGRPQFETSATAVIMTEASNRHRYESLLSGVQRTESCLHRHLVAHLNAEIVLGTITDIEVALSWLKNTFLYVRVLQLPAHYGLPAGLGRAEVESHLQDLCMVELNRLSEAGLIHKGEVEVAPSPSGRLMARFCISFQTMRALRQMSGEEGLPETLAVLAACGEFEGIQLRTSDKRTLNSLNRERDRTCVRHPLPGKVRTTEMKVNCLVQAVLGCLPIPDPSLSQDATKIFRVAQRVMRCATEYLCGAGRHRAYLSAVLLAKCVRARLWPDSEYVSRQLDGVGPQLSAAIVNAGLKTLQQLVDAGPRHVELVVNRLPPFGTHVVSAARALPRYLLRVEQADAPASETADVVVTVTLRDQDFSVAASTAGPSHCCLLVVGDQDNRLLCAARVTDGTLARTGELRRRITTSRCSAGDELSINFISESWVGLDVETVFTPQYLPRPPTTSCPAPPPLQPPPPAPAAAASGSSGVRTCNHRCLDKLCCGHACCRVGVPVKRAGALDRVAHMLRTGTPAPPRSQGPQGHQIGAPRRQGPGPQGHQTGTPRPQGPQGHQTGTPKRQGPGPQGHQTGTPRRQGPGPQGSAGGTSNGLVVRPASGAARFKFGLRGPAAPLPQCSVGSSQRVPADGPSTPGVKKRRTSQLTEAVTGEENLSASTAHYGSPMELSDGLTSGLPPAAGTPCKVNCRITDFFGGRRCGAVAAAAGDPSSTSADDSTLTSATEAAVPQQAQLSPVQLEVARRRPAPMEVTEFEQRQRLQHAQMGRLYSAEPTGPSAPTPAAAMSSPPLDPVAGAAPAPPVGAEAPSAEAPPPSAAEAQPGPASEGYAPTAAGAEREPDGLRKPKRRSIFRSSVAAETLRQRRQDSMWGLPRCSKPGQANI